MWPSRSLQEDRHILSELGLFKEYKGFFSIIGERIILTLCVPQKERETEMFMNDYLD